MAIHLNPYRIHVEIFTYQQLLINDSNHKIKEDKYEEAQIMLNVLCVCVCMCADLYSIFIQPFVDPLQFDRVFELVFEW